MQNSPLNKEMKSKSTSQNFAFIAQFNNGKQIRKKI